MSQSANSLPKVRILYLSWRDQDNPEAGGAEVFTERTSEVMASEGAEVTVYSARFPGAARDAQHGPVTIRRRGNRFTVYPAGLLHILRKHRDYDIILDVQNGIPFFSPLVARLPWVRLPVINIVHHVHHSQWHAFFPPLLAHVGWFLESRVAPFIYAANPYITVSKATRWEMAGIGIDAEKIDLIYSGNDQPADLESYAEVPCSQYPSLTVLCRLVPHKNVEGSIDILAALDTEFPDLRLNIVGSGAWQEELVKYAQKLGVLNRIDFHGFVSEEKKHEILAASWLLLMTSHKEGWGLTIVEAGLHGTPAVAFADAGGPRESIQHGRTGVLSKDESSMVEDVRYLLQDHELRHYLGVKAAEFSRSFSWEIAGNRVLQSIYAVLGLGTRRKQEPDKPVIIEPLHRISARIRTRKNQ